MPVYRGIGQRPFRKNFEQILATGRYSEKNDASVLTGEQTFSRRYGKVVDKTIGIVCDLRGDYLIYGWRPWGVPMTLIWMFSLGFLVAGIVLTVMRDVSGGIFAVPSVITLFLTAVIS